MSAPMFAIWWSSAGRYHILREPDRIKTRCGLNALAQKTQPGYVEIFVHKLSELLPVGDTDVCANCRKGL